MTIGRMDIWKNGQMEESTIGRCETVKFNVPMYLFYPKGNKTFESGGCFILISPRWLSGMIFYIKMSIFL